MTTHTEQPLPTREHAVKVNEDAFADLISGRKTFEVRRNDRYYQPGDTLRMTEVSRDNSAMFARAGGRYATARVGYVHSGYGLEHGFVVLGLTEMEGPHDH